MPPPPPPPRQEATRTVGETRRHRSEELVADGLSMVPHARRQQVYIGILEGRYDFTTSSSGRDALQLDVEDDCQARPKRAPRARAFAIDRQSEVEDPLDDQPDSDSNDSMMLAELEAALMEPAQDVLVAGLDGFRPASGALPALAPPPPPLEDAGPVAPQALVEVGEIRPDIPELRSGMWGIFRITPKRPGTANGPHGSYQARCPFHAKSKVTGCKKTLRIDGPTKSDQADTLRRLMFWCSQVVASVGGSAN